MKIKLIDPNCIPVKAKMKDVAMDLKTRIGDFSIMPMQTWVFPLGVCIAVPDGYTGDIRPRSGNTSNGLVVHYGTIDPGYTGELGAIVTNLSNTPIFIKRYMRIAQFVLIKVDNSYELEVVEELEQTERGENGFGSSGN